MNIHTYEFDLKLGDGRVVQWEGADGIDASIRYADAHPASDGEKLTVLAWRRKHDCLGIGLKPIIEPGMKGF